MEITVNCPDCGKKLNITVTAEESPQTEIIRRTSHPTTWGEISEKIKAGKAREILSVGDIIPFTMKDGQTVNAVVAEIDPYDKNEVAFVIEDCLAYRYVMNEEHTNAGGWRDCKMREYLNNTIFGLLPDGLRSVIAERTIMQNVRGKELVSCDKLWLMSSTEAGTDSEVDKDDEHFSLFKDNRSLRKWHDGSPMMFFLRTPYAYNNVVFHAVNHSGKASCRSADNTAGVVFGFLIK